MKMSSFKRSLAAFLAILMIITSIPIVVNAASANIATSTDGAYLMAYFTGQGAGEQIYFAVSKDGYNYESINQKQPMVAQGALSVGSTHMRDPYIFRGENGDYWLLATDLDADKTNYSNNAIYVFKSTNLTDWSMHSHIEMDNYIANTTRFWAPQALWDAEKGAYMLYWSQQTNSGITNLYRAYTTDFTTLTDIAQLYAPIDESGNLVNAIDADIIWNDVDNEWCLYYKNEDKKAINLATSANLTGPYSNDAPAIGSTLLPKDENEAAREGCQMFNIHGTDTWILMADAYMASTKEFFFYGTSDFKSFSNINRADYQVNHLTPRHGSVMWITNEEYENIIKVYGKATATQSGLLSGEKATDFLIARYFADYNNPATDASGRNHPLTTTNNLEMAVVDDIIAAKFTSANGSYGAVNTKDMFASANIKTGITVTFRAKCDGQGSTARYFEFTDSPFETIDGGGFFGGGNKSKYNDGYLQTNGRFELMQKGSEYQQNNDQSDFTMPVNAWHTYSFSISYGTVAVAVDGKLQKLYVDADKTLTSMDSWFNATFLGEESKLGLGISGWIDDPRFNGYISDFCIFSRALTGTEAFEAMESLLAAPQKNIEATTQLYFDNCGSDYTYTDTASDTAYGSNIVKDDTYESVLSTNGTVINSYVPSFTNTENSADGYTLSFLYNPQSTIENNAVIDIGNSKLSITEQGTLRFNSGTGSSYTVENIFDNKLTANKWHNVTVQVVPNFAFERIFVYVDGQLTSTTDTYLNMDGSNYPNPSICEAVFESGAQNVAYGSATGLLNNVLIYKGCADAASLKKHEDATYASKIINIEIKNFEQAVKEWDAANGKIFTGVGAAYKAYDACLRYLDSIEYGNTQPDPAVYAELAENLRTATAAMKNSSYTIPSASGTYLVNDGSSTGDILGTKRVDANTILPGSASNILWSSGICEIGADNDGQQNVVTLFANNPVDVQVIYGDTFFLYDGNANTFNMPVMFSGKCTDLANKTRLVTTVYPTKSTDDASDSGIFKLLGHINAGTGNFNCVSNTEPHWHGFCENGVTNFNQINYPSTANKAYGGKSWFGGDAADTGDRFSDSFAYYQVGGGIGKTYYYSNIMNFDIAALNGDGSNYSGYTPFTDKYVDASGQKIDVSDWIGTSKIAGKYNISWAVVGASSKVEKTWNDAPDNERANFRHNKRFVYVVDDSELLRILNSANLENYIHNIATYTSDSALHFTEAVDALTSIDFSVNFANGESEGAKLQQKIDSAVNEFNKSILDGAAEQLTPKANYESLKEELKDPKYVDAYENPDLTKYTASSVANYRNVYDNYVAHFTDMNPVLDNSQDYLSSTELTGVQFGGRIDVKYAQLMEKIDYSELVNKNAQFGHETLFTTDENSKQQYSYNSWAPYEEVTTLSTAIIDNNTAVLSNITDLNNQPLTDDNGELLVFGVDNTPKYTTVPVTLTLNDGSKVVCQIPSNHLTSEYIIDSSAEYSTADANTQTKQAGIVTATAQAIQPRNEALDAVADYTAYDATTNLLKYQDVGAFSDAYLTSEDSVYKMIDTQGTKDSRITYANGVASGVTCTTPAFSGTQTAYVTVDGNVLMNTGRKQQSALDATTVDILETLQQANESEQSTGADGIRRSYNVTYNIMLGDTPETATQYSAVTESRYYGQEYTANIPEGLTGYKWIVEQNGVQAKEMPAAQSYTAMIHDNITITAYCSNQQLEGDIVKLKVLNMYKNVIQEFNLAADTAVTVDANKYIINGTEYIINDSPFYRFNKWQVNGKEVANGTALNLAELKDDAGVVELYAGFAVLHEDIFDVTMDGVKVSSQSGNPLYYDTVVDITAADGAYGIAVDLGGSYAVVSYETAYTFYTYASVSLYSIMKGADGTYTVNGNVIDDAASLRKLNEKLPFVFAVPQNKADSFTTYSTYSKGSNTVVTEVGTLYTTDASIAANPDAFVFGTAGVKSVKASNPLETAQYWLRINTNGKTVYTRPYVKFKYSPMIDVDGGADGANVHQGTTIQSIEYGNICTNK